MRSELTQEKLLKALEALSAKLAQKETTGEICLFGGAVMVLAFTARVSTKDVDAIFQPAQLIRQLADDIAEEQQLPSNWLNDAVKGYISTRHKTTAEALPQFPNLRLIMPVPEYLLAMKCMAARIGGTIDQQSDVPDIIFLVKHLKLKTAPEVLDLVGQYYPANRIPVKAQYLVESLFEEGQI